MSSVKSFDRYLLCSVQQYTFSSGLMENNPLLRIEYFQDNVIDGGNPDRLGFPAHLFLHGDEFKYWIPEDASFLIGS